MKLYIIRHGETDWNKIRKMQGRSDIPLNEDGRAAAAEAGRKLKDVSFDLIISSPLKRAVETARLVCKDPDIPMYVDERLQEISFGSLEGMTQDNVKEGKFADFFADPGSYQPPEDGESLEALMTRTAEFLSDLAKQIEYHNDTILISTHGAAKCSILNNIDHTPAEHFWRKGVPDNCEYSIIEYKDGVYSISREYEKIRGYIGGFGHDK